MIKLFIALLHTQQLEEQMSPCLPEVLTHPSLIGPQTEMLAVLLDADGE